MGVYLKIGDMVRVESTGQVWRIVGERLKTSSETPRHPQGDQWAEYQLEATLPDALKPTRVWHEAFWLVLVSP